jgi:phage tail sheath protein FI
MPVNPTYPGVYIQELPSGVHTIVGVPTSITAFVGRALRGPVNEPTMIHGFEDYERRFGGLWGLSPMSYAVQQFYLNRGSDALIVRVHNGATPATIVLDRGGNQLTLAAESPGVWGNRLQATVDLQTRDSTDASLFNLVVEEVGADGVTRDEETLRNISVNPNSSRPVTAVLATESRLVRVSGGLPGAAPAPATYVSAGDGTDGTSVRDADIIGSATAPKTGIYALDNADIFNLLCIPPLDRGVDVSPVATLDPALAYCGRKRAMLIVDAPSGWVDKDAAKTGLAGFLVGHPNAENAALYFPRVKAPDPLQENRLDEFAPCGIAAGVIARTDLQRGVWKAPAGLGASLAGVKELTVRLTDAEQGELNPLAVNCFRVFPDSGKVVWGARTLRGSDRQASEWKYIPVRRLALYIEETLFRGTQWVVFEPNDAPLWAQIRLNVGAFMQDLFRQGAFQGSTPREAYFVRCDGLTTTQTDIDRGIVNIIVGFAPLKPAEFVIISIQQIAGQIPV